MTAARRRILSRKLLLLVLIVTITVVIVPLAISLMVDTKTNSFVYTVASAPYRKVGIVLGTSRRARGGGVNQYYRERMITAAELYAAGKIQVLLVSGDNGTVEYNEPDLVSLGVPADRIALDFAGFDTYDSMVRAKKVWGIDSTLVISQEFHVRRAIYIAQHRDINALGVVAREPSGTVSFTSFREFIARLKMVLDVHILQSEPKYLGPPESLPLDTHG